jgi:type IV pilus assembly protein PilO
MSSMTKRQKERALIFLAILFLLAIAAYSYFMMYSPAREAKLQAEQLLTSEREVLMALEAQLKEVPEGEKISTSELQQKVAVEPLSEMIVLQIEQAELLSNSLVTNIEIVEELVTLPVPVEGLENLHQVLTNVTFEMEDYKSITTFIKEIESMKRIMIVESIDFGSYDEVTKADQEREPVEVTVGFSSYYRPDLIALADTLPKVDAPAPAGKLNPLPQNDGTDLADEEEVEPAVGDADVEVDVEVNVDDDSVGAATGAPNPNVAGSQTATTHKVQKGETLYTIALRYFNSNVGMERIKEANGMKSEALQAGQTLIIPARP